jgi:hypothetical protein
VSLLEGVEEEDGFSQWEAKQQKEKENFDRKGEQSDEPKKNANEQSEILQGRGY